MHNRVIVIHESEIILSGLSNIIQKSFENDPIQLHSISELENYTNFSKMNLVFLIDDKLNSNQLDLKLDYYKKSNSVKIILVRSNLNSSGCHEGCDCCLSINASSEKISQLLNPFLSNKNLNESKKSISGLTERETEVVKLIALGKTNKEMADELFISIHTVISHRKNITEKLGIKSISGLTVYAILNNLIDATTIDPESLI